MIKEHQIVEAARTLSSKVWYTGAELAAIWDVLSGLERKDLVPHMKKRDMIRTKGNTSNIQYKLRPEADWLVDMTLYTKPVETTGNGVIDAKLRKEAGLPATTSSLENLISAATELGTDNEILRNKLVRIRAILEEV